MCDICGTAGTCICRGPATPENPGTRYGPGGAESITDRVVRLWHDLARLQHQAEEVERELAALLAARGSRPGDGSDQPALFEIDTQPRLF